jgi:hypothetical protein
VGLSALILNPLLVARKTGMWAKAQSVVSAVHFNRSATWKNSPQFSAKSAFALKSQMRLNSHLPVTLD